MKAKTNHDPDHNVEDDVNKEEDGSNGVKASEAIGGGYSRQHICNPFLPVSYDGTMS